MPLSTALQEFVDDELTRMPALIEQVRRQTVEGLRQPADAGLSPTERMQRFDIAKELETQAQRFNDAFVAELSGLLRSDSTAA